MTVGELAALVDQQRGIGADLIVAHDAHWPGSAPIRQHVAPAHR
jgi:uncharacterized protein YbbC (DUF1343 family)